ncbi:30S ribosomal protein S8 [Candidatus Uzinura diaspidicola str. ASNER]|uniref:Small ribosomal subunit protein uS8 n=1 Tax=Candidatus Uzinura diaspidicola str. ASNER TaxID=1133592 RepID=L7VG31_9FLAO|nr:30S ribosomal protein S8 [Candidatus Uzinura diaspidicola str. ASNER]
MYTDTIADFLTRIRNALSAGHRVVKIPSSKFKKEITKILFNQGYISNYRFENSDYPQIKIALKYDSLTHSPVIRSIKRISRPGLRKYSSCNKLPRILNGLGIAIISTSSGIMTEKTARKKTLGGEIICHVY